MTAEEIIKLIAQADRGHRYRILELTDETYGAAKILLKDDGYRLHYLVLESLAVNASQRDWEFLMEYKQQSSAYTDMILDWIMEHKP